MLRNLNPLRDVVQGLADGRNNSTHVTIRTLSPYWTWLTRRANSE